jgi:RHS repeat-associated protein
VLWREGYRPYRERRLNQPAAAGNREFFHGKAFDADTGLSYFGARYYDPAVGRFRGVDPKAFDDKNLHSTNRFAYGNNNPYKFKDPTGEFPILLFLVPILHGAASGAAIAEFLPSSQISPAKVRHSGAT